MECLLLALMTGTVAVAVMLAVRLRLLHRDMDRLEVDIVRLMREDTNVGLDTASGDRQLRRLIGTLDRQLGLLRREHLRYAQGDQELKQAVTGISHDLRTPLTAICGYLELLDREALPQQTRDYLKIISGRVETMRTLTEELLRYSVVLSPDAYGEREWVDLTGALTESLAAFYGAFCSKGITPEILLPEKPVHRWGNRQAVGRIFSNVISNMLRYGTGDVRVVLTEDGTASFRNRAEALDAVQVGRLFDRYVTVSSGAEGGTGLGLSIAKQLVEQMGGTIFAEIQGAYFSVTVGLPTREIGAAAHNAPITLGRSNEYPPIAKRYFGA